MSNKNINLVENNNMNDQMILDYMKSHKIGNLMRGHVKIYADNGECILEKDNLIVRRGRTFAIEKIFNKSSAGAVNPIYKSDNLNNKKVALFTCGYGGHKNGLPFEVNAEIDPDSMNLNKPIPFKLYEEGVSQPGYHMVKDYPEGEKIPYYVTEEYTDPDTGLPKQRQVVKYKLPKAYYAKEFRVLDWNTDPEGVISGSMNDNGVDDEVFIRLELKIDTEDFKTIKTMVDGKPVIKRAEAISELGLLICDENMNDDSIELFSKIHFSSEAMNNPSKTLTIHYFIYA